MTLLRAHCPEAARQSEKCARTERTLNTFHAHMLACVPWRTFRHSVKRPGGGSVVCLRSGWFVLCVFGSVYSGHNLQKQKAGPFWGLTTASIAKRCRILRNVHQLVRFFPCRLLVFPPPSGVFSSSTVNRQKVLFSFVIGCWFHKSFGLHLMH